MIRLVRNLILFWSGLGWSTSPGLHAFFNQLVAACRCEVLCTYTHFHMRPKQQQQQPTTTTTTHNNTQQHTHTTTHAQQHTTPTTFWLKPFWLKSNCGSSFTLQQCRLRVEKASWGFFVCNGRLCDVARSSLWLCWLCRGEGDLFSEGWEPGEHRRPLWLCWFCRGGGDELGNGFCRRFSGVFGYSGRCAACRDC